MKRKPGEVKEKEQGENEYVRTRGEMTGRKEKERGRMKQEWRNKRPRTNKEGRKQNRVKMGREENE